MPDSIFKGLAQAMGAFANSISSNTMIIGGICVILISAVLAITYKIASYDYDVYFTASRTMCFIRKPREKRIGGSLNFYMRCFPKEIGKQWDRFYKVREGKPSDYFSICRANTSGVMDSVIVLVVKTVVVIVLAVNGLYALGQKDISIQNFFAMMFIPIVTGAIAILLVNFGFNLVKVLSESKFQDLLHLLDFYSLSDFDGILPPARRKVIVENKNPSTLSRFEMERSEDLEGISTFKKKIQETANNSSEIESLALKLSLEKPNAEIIGNEEKLNSAINDLMTTLAMQDKEENSINENSFIGEVAKIYESKEPVQNEANNELSQCIVEKSIETEKEINDMDGKVIYAYNKTNEPSNETKTNSIENVGLTLEEMMEMSFPGAINTDVI